MGPIFSESDLVRLPVLLVVALVLAVCCGGAVGWAF